MKKPWFILVSGLVVAAAGYGIFYLGGTQTGGAMEHGTAPELKWVKSEFRLGDAEYTRVCQLHAAYVPQCRDMCQRIDQKNEQIQNLVLNSAGVTPAIEKALQDAAQLRLECQTMMLKYFFEVSKTMPSAEGKRYLAEMQAHSLRPTPRTLTRP
jgi:hypothetical protein